MNAPRELLDQLDALHAEDEETPWRVDELDNHRIADRFGNGVAKVFALPSDAALIVAAVNTLPQLTAALRAVLAYCDDMDRADFFPGLASTAAIRTRITAALSPTHPMSAEPGMSQP